MSVSSTLLTRSETLLAKCRSKGLKLATAESCTGGLVAATLTDISGSSDVVERGYVTYSNKAKSDLLGVPVQTIAEYGAVSEPVARAMARGAIIRSDAEIAVAVTGIAGPGGGSKDKPVGLVHIASAHGSGLIEHQKCLFGADRTRREIRLLTVSVALDLLEELIAQL